MCRRIVSSIALLVVVVVRAVLAQSTTDYGRRYQALRRATAQLDAHFDSATTRRLVPGSIDTIRAGALVVYVVPRFRARASIATDSASQMLMRIFGQSAARASSTRLLLESTDRGDSASLAGALNSTSVQLPTATPVAQVTRGLLDAIAPAIYGHADAELKRWLPWIYVDTILRFHLDALYEELAVSSWSAARTCFSGKLISCRLALGITRVDPATGWYDATDRRNYVAYVLHSYSTAWRDCVDGGDDAACIVSLRRAPGGAPEPPLGVQARQLLLALAINAGGPEAYDRLIARPDEPLENRISAAAGVPIDTLVSRWRAQIVAAQPKTVAADARAAWAAVAWGVVLLGLALRSTRWR